MIEAIREAQRAAAKANDHYGTWDIQMIPLWEKLHEHLPPHPVIVELGICHARGSIYLASMAKFYGGEYHGVDAWVLEGSADEFWQTMETNGLVEVSHLHEGGTSSDLPGMPMVKWDQAIDLLMVDASHSEPWFSADCQRWLPFVNPGGFAYFDDWGIWPDGSGVTKEQAEAGIGPGPDHNPHWAIPYFGTIHTEGWVDHGMISRGRLFQKP